MSLGSVHILHKSLQDAKRDLEDTNEAIQRVTGRDPQTTFQSQKKLGGRTRSWSEDVLPQTKRRASGDFRKSRQALSPDSKGDETEKDTLVDESVCLKSSVTAAPVPPRPNIESNADSASKSRNRRMFGMLMGTLEKFQQAATKVSEQEKRRVEIEIKLEQMAVREKEKAAKERQELYDQRKLQRQRVGILTRQLATAEMYDEWNNHDRKLLGYIKTNTLPAIFYLPSIHNQKTEDLLTNTQEILHEVITARQNEIEALLKEQDIEYEQDPPTEDNKDGLTNAI